MKRVMMTAFALALLGGTSVLAAPQRDEDRGGRAERGDRGGQRGGGEERGGRPEGQVQERQREAPPPVQQAPVAAPQAAPQAQQDRGARPDFNRGDAGRRERPAQTAAPQGGGGGFIGQRLGQQQQQAQVQAQIQGRGRGDDGRFDGRVDSRPQAQQDPQARARAQAQAQGRGRGDEGRTDGRNYRGPGNDYRADGRNGRPDNDGRFDGRNGQRDNDGRFDGRNNGQVRDRDNRPGQDRNWNGRNGNDRWDRNGPPRGRPPVTRPQDRWDRDYNRPRYDRNRWVFLIQPRQHYSWRGPAYYAPYDFYPRSFAYGQVLPWSWYTQDYYINDWAWYGLPMPPLGCEWIRLGDDAVLVDVFTGRTLSVVYSLFW